MQTPQVSSNEVVPSSAIGTLPNNVPIRNNDSNVFVALSRQHRVLDGRDIRLFQVLKINPNYLMEQIVYGAEDNAVAQFIDEAENVATKHKDVICYQMAPGCKISCVNWNGRHYISGTDIVKFLMQRFANFCGRRPHSAKKFEEGIFSDLRRMQAPRDCQLEATRSDFLCYLFDFDCVRSKKKQKVFMWNAFKRCYDNLFCDAMQRELARIEMAKAVGMSIDQFIKSGIIPTGNSAMHDVHRQPLSFDWVSLAASRINSGDNDGASLMPIVQVDQVHFVRNDVNNLVDRNVRVNLPGRKQLFSIQAQYCIADICKSKTVAGEAVELAPVVSKKLTTLKKVTSKQSVIENVETSSESDILDEPMRPKRCRTVSKVKSENEFVQTPNMTPNLSGKHVSIGCSISHASNRYNPYGYRRSPFPFLRRFSVTQSWSKEVESDEEPPKSELFKSLAIQEVLDIPELSPKRLSRKSSYEIEAAAILVNMALKAKN